MSSVIGIGLDIVGLARFERLYGDEMTDLSRCFTIRELEYAGSGGDRLSRLAARFAAKEAVLKVLSGLEDGISWTDIEIISSGNAPPTVSLTGGALKKASNLGVTRWHVSLSHSDEACAAVALALG